MEISKLANFKKSEKFYINQMTSGHLNINEVNLTFASSDSNVVLINNLVPGVIKCSEDQRINEYEVIMSEIADLLEIESATVYRITNEVQEYGIISKYSHTKKELCMSMDYIFKKLYSKYLSLPKDPMHWMTKALNLPESTKENPLSDGESLKVLLDMGYNATIEAFNLNEEAKEKFKTKYYSMILFDFITGQAKRNAIDYSIIVNPDSHEARLSPISEYCNTNDTKFYYLNNRLVDRMSLITTLYENYYAYIKETSRCLVDHSGAYLKSIKLICDNNTDAAFATQIYNVIADNITILKKLDTNIAGIIPAENKVDFTQTTIRINQKVMRKNLLYQNKYPAVKNQIVVEKPKEEESDRVKVSFEELEPVKSSGFSNAFLITTIIAFVCGIGVGIAYIILLLNK